MKTKYFITLLLIIFLSGSTYPWGETAHQIIMRKAIEMLPEEMKFLDTWKEYLAGVVNDPDKRSAFDNSEVDKHFIRLDLYEEFLNGEIPYDKKILLEKYGEEAVTERGTLPWAAHESFENLTLAFSQMNRDRILIHIADLGHYTADGHQPMYTSSNYDGQLTGQHGIRQRYQQEMIDRNSEELEKAVTLQYTGLIYNPIESIMGFITDSHFKQEIILAADRASLNQTGSFNDDYYRLLWFRTGNFTKEQFNNAASSLAGLIFTAWSNAGKPKPGNFN
jgi:hypothetical protein